MSLKGSMNLHHIETIAGRSGEAKLRGAPCRRTVPEAGESSDLLSIQQKSTSRPPDAPETRAAHPQNHFNHDLFFLVTTGGKDRRMGTMAPCEGSLAALAHESTSSCMYFPKS